MMASRLSSACSFSSGQPSVPAGRSGILMKLRARARARVSYHQSLAIF